MERRRDSLLCTSSRDGDLFPANSPNDFRSMLPPSTMASFGSSAEVALEAVYLHRDLNLSTTLAHVYCSACEADPVNEESMPLLGTAFFSDYPSVHVYQPRHLTFVSCSAQQQQQPFLHFVLTDLHGEPFVAPGVGNVEGGAAGPEVSLQICVRRKAAEAKKKKRSPRQI